MCTVTFIPANKQVFITSNRDEKHWRSCALSPEFHRFESGRILYPKDADAGGTWIAAHENGNAIVFLNGGFVCHTPNPPYRKSRGLILLDLIDSYSPSNSFLSVNLSNIEPFTAIVWDSNELFECRWDGEEKHYKHLDKSAPHIWSSVTLYKPDIIQKREQWFANWLAGNSAPSRDDILHFHQFTGEGDCYNDLRMNRDGKVFTVSVTSLVLSDDTIDMQYLDLKNGKNFSRQLCIEKTMAGR
jgi:hypothetical protein